MKVIDDAEIGFAFKKNERVEKGSVNCGEAEKGKAQEQI